MASYGGAGKNDEEDVMEWTLANIVRAHAAQRGGQPMVTYSARTITYAAMDAASNRVAQRIRASPPRTLQVPDLGRFRGCVAAEPIGQAAQAPASGAVLEGARAPHQLMAGCGRSR